MISKILVAISLIFLAATSWAQTEKPSCTLALKVTGAITPGTLDYLERGFARANAMKCESILLEINSPGGALNTTRLIVEKILASPIPVLCLVSPSGGHAGSAGAIILMACHVSGAEPATNIGAATPIDGSGQSITKDLREKIVQDTVSWVVGLARLRGRDLDFAQKVVTEAKAVDADEAARTKVIDTMALDRARFLDFAEGREVVMAGDTRAQVKTGAVVEYQSDLRNKFLQLVTDPQLAYLLFMASIALIYFELTHAGVVVPGVVGGIGLIVSMIAFHHLDVYWGGMALIALGIGFLIAEAFVPSFGALGIGGVIALGAGSVLLYDPPTGEVFLPYSTIIATCTILGACMLALATLAFRTRNKGAAIAEKAILGRIGEVASLEAPSLRKGMVIVQGEYWRFHSDKDVLIGTKVQVLSQQGLLLKVQPVQA